MYGKEVKTYTSSKSEIKSCPSSSAVAAQGRLYGDKSLRRPVMTKALRVASAKLVRAFQRSQLITRKGGVVVAGERQKDRLKDHDDAQCDDGATVEHSAQHPCPMLVDLQAFDIIIGHAQARSHNDRKEADAGLCRRCAAKRFSRQHEGARDAEEEEDGDDVAVDAMEEDELVPDDGHELPDHQQSCGYDGSKVHHDANTVVSGLVVEPFARCSSACEYSDVQVLQPSQREAEHGTSEYDDC